MEDIGRAIDFKDNFPAAATRLYNVVNLLICLIDYKC